MVAIGQPSTDIIIAQLPEAEGHGALPRCQTACTVAALLEAFGNYRGPKHGQVTIIRLSNSFQATLGHVSKVQEYIELSSLNCASKR